MSAINLAIQNYLQLPTNDNCQSSVTATQTGAPVLPGAKNRITAGASTQSFCLEAITTGEAGQDIVWVINDGPNQANIYPAVGEKMNGTTNATQTIAAGATGIFVRIRNPNPDWRSNTIA